METKKYSVVDFIQHLKDIPYTKLYKASRLSEIKIRKEMRRLRGHEFYFDRE